MNKIRLCGVIVMGGLSGCANLNSVHHEFETPAITGSPQGKAVSVDVKQRFLQMSLDPNQKNAAGEVYPYWVMCAEPSPDALAAYSGSLTGNAQVQLPTEAAAKNIAAAMAAAFAEQATAFGLRTQSITLLRDSAFRLCEGFMNKSLEPRQFEILHRRLQNVMVATLAIEQITGYARPTVTAIGGSASASSAARAQQALRDLEKARKDQVAKEDAATTTAAAADKTKTAATQAGQALDTAKASATAATTQAATDAQAVTDAQKALDAIPATPPSDQRKNAEAALAKAKETATASNAAKVAADKKVADLTDAKATADAAATKAKNAADAAEKSQADAKANTKLAEEALEAAQGVAADATGTAPSFSTPVSSPAISKEVAGRVADIVQMAIDRDYTKDTCLDYLVGRVGQFDPEVKTVCVDLMKAITASIVADANARAAQPPARPTRAPDGGPSGSGVFGPYNR